MTVHENDGVARLRRVTYTGLRVKPERVATLIRRQCPAMPRLAVVLGSGFAGVLDAIDQIWAIRYDRLRGFPPASVAGHPGELVVGRLGQGLVLVLAGRAHYYEGHALSEITFPIRVLAALGIEAVLLTNAAGGIHRGLRPGDFLILSDHLNIMGVNPLRGGPVIGSDPFLDLSQVYDVELQRLLVRAARAARVRSRSGVYAAVSGPTYETPAEVRALARLGADAVGMSTVPEALVARQCGLRVAGLSCIGNRAAGGGRGTLSHAEVLATGLRVGPQATDLVIHFVRLWERVNPGVRG